MKLIKISTDLELTVHDFPTGTHSEQNDYLRGLIGNDCELYEHVMPERLYTDLKMKDRPTKILWISLERMLRKPWEDRQLTQCQMHQ